MVLANPSGLIVLAIYLLRRTGVRRSRMRPSAIVLVQVYMVVACSWLAASDHADPMDLTRLQPLEPVITDLFAFPVDADGKVAVPFERPDKIRLHNPDLSLRRELTADERDQIEALIIILCVRRALLESGSLDLEPYRYRIHMDTATTPEYFDTIHDNRRRNSVRSIHERPSVQEARVRYGGFIQRPENIEDDVEIEIRLNNDATLDGFRVNGLGGYKDGRYATGKLDPNEVSVWTGIRDDPFIFPAFSRTNVVAMVIHIPLRYFERQQRDWLIWATSWKGNEQIDHVGRSLRTQSPRFEMLNTLHPREHVAAIRAEHEDPGLLRDVALRLNVQSLFAYREWDFFPDVMIYTNRFPVGFPNGRLLEDDVAAILAQHGDTLLLELSHHNAQWPRVEGNLEKILLDEFPYLAEPWLEPQAPEPHYLSLKNKWILAMLGIVALVIIALALAQLWLIVRRLLGIRPRQFYL